MNAGWDVVLVEPGRTGASNARARGLQHVVCATTTAAGFRNNHMAAIGVLDVVEHTGDDVTFLRHLNDLLEPGGMLDVTMPAYQGLWSQADVVAGHFRRDALPGLRDKLRRAGLEVCYATHFFCALPIVLETGLGRPAEVRLGQHGPSDGGAAFRALDIGSCQPCAD